MAGMPGPALDGATEALIRERGLGGIILFGRNIEHPLQLASLCRDLQRVSTDCHGIPLFLAVDQEGGRVARLKAPFTRFKGNSWIGASPRPEEMAGEFARVTSEEMRLVGLNMNLAPVLDVPRGEPEAHLAGRTFCHDPEKVADLGRTVIEGLQRGGVMAVAKHFPGLGRTDLDPHHHLPTISVTEEELDGINLPPFRAAVASGVCGIMTSHAVYPSLDPDLPATLSARVITGLLRERMGFGGLVITDDLEMGAIQSQWGTAGGALMAFEAGADILLICRDQSNVTEAVRMIRDRIIRGEIPLVRLEQSVNRIMVAKDGYLKRAKGVSLDRVSSYFA